MGICGNDECGYEFHPHKRAHVMDCIGGRHKRMRCMSGPHNLLFGIVIPNLRYENIEFREALTRTRQGVHI